MSCEISISVAPLRKLEQGQLFRLRVLDFGLLQSRSQTGLRRLRDVERRTSSAVTNFVSHAEQVPQDIGRDAGQANQHAV